VRRDVLLSLLTLSWACAGIKRGTTRTRLAVMIQASLNYLGEMPEKPAFHVFDSSRHNLNLVSHTVPVRDAREIPAGASLDREGFCLVRHHTCAARLESRREVLRVYGPELERLVGELTGAAAVIAEPIGVVRVACGGARALTTPAHPPLRFVHADFTLRSVSWLIRRLLPTDEVELFGRGRRCVVYNIWRSLTPPPQDVPLAVCDLRTVDPDGAVAADALLDFPGSRPGMTESTLFHRNARHNWYYYPDMSGDDVLIFKSFDSAIAHGGWVPHSAFNDPTCRLGVPGRESIDLRVLALF